MKDNINYISEYSDTLKNYLKLSIKSFLDDLSSNLPVPGGGAASALVSSLGASCFLMVANFTLNKKGYEKYQQEVKELIEKFTGYKNHLEQLINKDIEAYNEVNKSYKLPKTTLLDSELRNKQIQQALKNSTLVAFEIIEISHNCIILADKLLKVGNKNLITDIACGVLFLSSGISAAKYNVLINLKSINDSKFCSEIKKRIKKIYTDTKIITKKFLQKINI